MTDRDPNWADAQGIGDVNSDARGSGARFNTGKPAMELLPIKDTATLLIGHWLKYSGQKSIPEELKALSLLGEFQITGDDKFVYAAMECLGPWTETIVECAEVFSYGARKYASWNWAKGMKWSVPLACAVRHLLSIHQGEWIDPVEQKGSGLPHRGHVMCNLFMLTTYIRNFPEGNDLPIGTL